VAIRADHTSKTTVQYRQSNLRKQVADVWCRECAVINSRHVDPPQSVSFYQPRFDTLYCADEAVVCQEATGGGRQIPACRRLIRPDVLRGQGAVIRIRTSAEPSRLVTYDNATVSAAAVHQLHKRACRGRPPARCGLFSTSQRSSFLRVLSSFSRSTCRGGVSASILFSGGRYRRRYV